MLKMAKYHKICITVLLAMGTGLASPYLQAQSQSDKNLCENFSRIGAQNAQLRDQGKTQEQVIAYNSRYIADVMNRNNVFQEYLTMQAKKLYTDDYINLKPEQIKTRLYEDCILIFK